MSQAMKHSAGAEHAVRHATNAKATFTPPAITLDVTPEMEATLHQIARESGQPLDIVFTKAIALYRAALNANNEGKHVGYASSADSLDVEFTGLTAGARP